LDLQVSIGFRTSIVPLLEHAAVRAANRTADKKRKKKKDEEKMNGGRRSERG
jgi:hypothetical protein